MNLILGPMLLSKLTNYLDLQAFQYQQDQFLTMLYDMFVDLLLCRRRQPARAAVSRLQEEGIVRNIGITKVKVKRDTTLRRLGLGTPVFSLTLPSCTARA